jgi:NAD(P)-dependent dehydrogenase (short-subunit alcohol dehydrogenase family)
VVNRQIRINGLNLGWMDTPGEEAIQKRFHNASDQWLKEAERMQPFGRLIKPGEVAEVVAFLLSEKSGLMTGSIIDFDQNVVGTRL